MPNKILPQKTIKNNNFFNTADVPKEFNDELIKKLMKDKRFKTNELDFNIKKSSHFPSQLKSRRIPFTKEEDEKIIQLVNTFGSSHWKLISRFIEGRTSKQCRDRYTNYLLPGVFQGEWMKEEDSLLTKLYNKFGPKWSTLQKYIPYRSANNIKNRWHYFLSKQNQVTSKSENESEVKSTFDESTNTQNEDSVNLHDESILLEPENEINDDNRINIKININEDDNSEIKNIIFDFENEWIINGYPSESKSALDK